MSRLHHPLLCGAPYTRQAIMLNVRRSSLLRCVVLPVMSLAFLSACHKWVPLEPPVARTIAEKGPGAVRVTLADSSQVVLDGPRISGDSLVARDGGIGMAIDDAREIEVRQTKVLATVGLITGVAAVAAFGWAVAVSASWRR